MEIKGKVHCFFEQSGTFKNEFIKLGISGHYSSHCMRNTFAEFISRDFEDNRNPLAASKALNHADVKTTIEHYMKVNPQRLKLQWQNLNLGLEVWEMFIEDFYGKS